MPTFAEQMVTKLEARMLDLAGVKRAGLDGESTEFEDLKREWEWWNAKVARENGTRPRIAAIKTGGV